MLRVDIDMDESKLRRLGTMLICMADALSAQPQAAPAPMPQAAPAPVPQAAPAPVPQAGPAVFSMPAPMPQPQAAPMPQPQAAPMPQPQGEVDIEGIPWDKRIHASTRTKLKSGAWKLKPGVDKAQAEMIKKELKSGVVSEAPAVSIKTFPELMVYVNQHNISSDDLLAACKKHGVQSLPLLAVNEIKIPLVAAEIIK